MHMPMLGTPLGIRSDNGLDFYIVQTQLALSRKDKLQP